MTCLGDGEGGYPGQVGEGGVVEGVGGVTWVVGGDTEDALRGCGGPVGRGEGQPVVRAGVKRVNLGHVGYCCFIGKKRHLT